MGSAPQGKYIPWDAPGVETIQPGEQEKIWEVSEQFKRFQMMNFNEHMHCLRGTHLKTQGVSNPSVRISARTGADLASNSALWAASSSTTTCHRISLRACSLSQELTTASCATSR